MTDTNRAEGLADGFDGSDVSVGPNHSTIKLWYDTEAQARAARTIILSLIDAAQRAEVEASRLPLAGAGDAAVQQPVAWMYETDAVNDRQSDAGWVPYKVTHIHQNAKFAALNNHTPLYTSPLPTAQAGAREALAELLAVDELKRAHARAQHEFAACEFADAARGDVALAEVSRLSNEIARRQKPAWDAARAALAAAPLERIAPPVRALNAGDPFCPKCGHNRDKSSVSSIDKGNALQSCQMCGSEWVEHSAPGP